jgi:hypothetical protein
MGISLENHLKFIDAGEDSPLTVSYDSRKQRVRVITSKGVELSQTCSERDYLSLKDTLKDRGYSFCN